MSYCTGDDHRQTQLRKLELTTQQPAENHKDRLHILQPLWTILHLHNRPGAHHNIILVGAGDRLPPPPRPGSEAEARGVQIPGVGVQRDPSAPAPCVPGHQVRDVVRLHG